MKRLSILLLLLASQPLKADSEWLGYDANRRVPWANNPAYTRDESDWFISNEQNETRLYFNGIYQGSEYGDSDIGLAEAWKIHPQGVTIGIVDVNSEHGQRVAAVAGKVSRNSVFLSNLARLYPDDIAAGISNFVAMRFPVIVVTTGFNFAHSGLSNACRFAESRNVLVFCAVPNAAVDIDVTHDYPSSWANEMDSIVPVTATDRMGNLYGPGAAAWGNYVIGAPGRNIVCDTNYTSGTSVATPIAAGVTAILMQHKRGRTAAQYRAALWSTAIPAAGISRFDALKLLTESEL